MVFGQFCYFLTFSSFLKVLDIILDYWEDTNICVWGGTIVRMSFNAGAIFNEVQTFGHMILLGRM